MLQATVISHDSIVESATTDYLLTGLQPPQIHYIYCAGIRTAEYEEHL